MTLDQWLRDATGTFPAGVQKRLAQEYRAHLEESVAAGGIGDPVVLFGRPKKVRQQLKKTYLDVEGWRIALRARPFMTWFFPFQVLIVNGISWPILIWKSPSLTTGILLLAVWLTVLLTSRHLLLLHRINLRQNISFLCSVLFTLIISWSATKDLIWLQLFCCISALYYCFYVFIANARLRRTVELEKRA
jgi:hypothetical protein